jgi:Tol biopolymer transport system component
MKHISKPISILFSLLALVVLIIGLGLISGTLPSLGQWFFSASPLAPPSLPTALQEGQMSPLGTPVPLPEKPQSTATSIPSATPTVPPPPGWPTGVPWPPQVTPEPPKPTPTRPPSLAPVGSPPDDQQSLYYVADNAGYSELHAVGMDEQGKQQSEFDVAVNLPYENALVGLHPSPDGKYLAMEFCLGPQDNLLLVMERISGQIWCPLGKQERCLGGFWDWTRDNQLLFRPTAGNQLEGVIPGGALLVDINTGQHSQLDLPTSPDQVYSYAHNISLSPDDTRIAYAVTYAEDHKEISEIWTMRIGSENKQLVYKVEGVIHALSWSPAGEQLIYSYQPGSMPSANDPSELWMLNSDGTGARFVANNYGECCPVWSPDGSYIAFVRVDDLSLFLGDWRGPGTNVYVVDTITGGITRLSAFEGRSNTHTTWSPDGKFVAFVSTIIMGEPEMYSPGVVYVEVWVASVDGSQLYRVSETGRWNSALAWLPPSSSWKEEER